MGGGLTYLKGSDMLRVMLRRGNYRGQGGGLIMNAALIFQTCRNPNCIHESNTKSRPPFKHPVHKRREKCHRCGWTLIGARYMESLSYRTRYHVGMPKPKIGIPE